MTPTQAQPAPTRHPPTVLLIEDDEAQRKLMRISLTEAGFVVHEQPALYPALDLLESGFSPNACVVDLNLPNGKGLNVVRQLIAVEGRWPIVIVTGEYDEQWAEEAYNLHSRVQSYVHKTRVAYNGDGTAETLAKKVRDAMTRSAVIQREKSAATARAVIVGAPPSAWRKLVHSFAKEFSTRKSLRWMLRALAALLVGLGAALTRWSAQRPGQGIFADIIGTFVTAAGSALGVYVIAPQKKGD